MLEAKKVSALMGQRGQRSVLEPLELMCTCKASEGLGRRKGATARSSKRDGCRWFIQARHTVGTLV